MKNIRNLENKNSGQTIDIPYTVGDCVKWFCFDDYSMHKSKITSIEIEIVRGREPIITYHTRIKFKGSIQEAVFANHNIEVAKSRKLRV